MPRGNWCILVALAGLALLAAKPANERQPGQQEVPKAEVGSTGKPSTLHQSNSTPASEKSCAQGQDDRSSDLCAQWKAADAASSSADAAWLFGYLVGAIGSMTLLAAVAAAIYARSAALHTKTSAESFIQAERPVLRVVGAHEGEMSGGGREGPQKVIAVRFKNIGRTPARIIVFGSKVTGSAPRWADVPAGGEGVVAGPAVPNERNVILDGWFWIEYALIGGETGTANFKIRAAWMPDDGHSPAGWRCEVSNPNGHPDDT